MPRKLVTDQYAPRTLGHPRTFQQASVERGTMDAVAACSRSSSTRCCYSAPSCFDSSRCWIRLAPLIWSDAESQELSRSPPVACSPGRDLFCLSARRVQLLDDGVTGHNSYSAIWRGDELPPKRLPSPRQYVLYPANLLGVKLLSELSAGRWPVTLLGEGA